MFTSCKTVTCCGIAVIRETEKLSCHNVYDSFHGLESHCFPLCTCVCVCRILPCFFFWFIFSFGNHLDIWWKCLFLNCIEGITCTIAFCKIAVNFYILNATLKGHFFSPNPGVFYFTVFYFILPNQSYCILHVLYTALHSKAVCLPWNQSNMCNLIWCVCVCLCVSRQVYGNAGSSQSSQPNKWKQWIS